MQHNLAQQNVVKNKKNKETMCAYGGEIILMPCTKKMEKFPNILCGKMEIPNVVLNTGDLYVLGKNMETPILRLCKDLNVEVMKTERTVLRRHQDLTVVRRYRDFSVVRKYGDPNANV